jgi:hypothetical protein
MSSNGLRRSTRLSDPSYRARTTWNLPHIVSVESSYFHTGHSTSELIHSFSYRTSVVPQQVTEEVVYSKKTTLICMSMTVRLLTPTEGEVRISAFRHVHLIFKKNLLEHDVPIIHPVLHGNDGDIEMHVDTNAVATEGHTSRGTLLLFLSPTLHRSLFLNFL